MNQEHPDLWLGLGAEGWAQGSLDRHVGKFLKAATLFGKGTCQSLGQPHKKHLCVDAFNVFLLSSLLHL